MVFVDRTAEASTDEPMSSGAGEATSLSSDRETGLAWSAMDVVRDIEVTALKG